MLDRLEEPLQYDTSINKHSIIIATCPNLHNALTSKHTPSAPLTTLCRYYIIIWDLHSFEILRRTEWMFLTDKLGQPTCPIYKSQLLDWKETTILPYVKSHKMADLIYTVAEDWNYCHNAFLFQDMRFSQWCCWNSSLGCDATLMGE